MKLIERHLFGGILNSLKQLLKPKYSIDEVPTGPTPPVKGWTKLPILEPDVPVDTKTYNGGTLPGVTVSAINLSKPLPFPYGGINVVSKSINGGLDKKQRVFVNPFDKSYLASNYKEGGLIEKHQWGGVNKYKFRRGLQDLSNGYGITYDQILQTILNGLPTYDLPPVVSGRTIYHTPNGNDTIFYSNNKNVFDHTPKGDKNLKKAKDYFYKMVKTAPAEVSEYLGTRWWDNSKQLVYNAWLDAVRGYLNGGQTEAPDNTKVLHIPNNGEAVYERTPQGIGDFVPFLGTYRAAQRIDKGESNANYGDLIINGAMDLLGAGMVGPVLKAASKFRNIEKGLKSRGFVKGSERAHMKNGSGTDFHKRTVEVVNDYTGKPHYFEHWGEIKTVPNVDYYNVAMQPMIQTLRVPATAPFK